MKYKIFIPLATFPGQISKTPSSAPPPYFSFLTPTNFPKVPPFPFHSSGRFKQVKFEFKFIRTLFNLKEFNSSDEFKNR